MNDFEKMDEVIEETVQEMKDKIDKITESADEVQDIDLSVKAAEVKDKAVAVLNNVAKRLSTLGASVQDSDRIYKDDKEVFYAAFNKENIIRELDEQGVFTATYRLMDTGKPMYVNMKITRLRGGNRLILGVSIIDAHMKRLEEDKKLRQERISLGRIAALSPHYIVLYTIDPVTGHYIQYNPSKEFETFGLAEQGDDFFGDVVRDAPKAIAPDDIERHLCVFTKENMLREIREHGIFIHKYRLLLEGKIVPAGLKAKLIRESDGEKIILGVTIEEG